MTGPQDTFDATALIGSGEVRRALEKLKAEGFNMLVDLTATDYSQFGKDAHSPVPIVNPAPSGARFKLTYRLMNLDAEKGLVNARVAVQCWVAGTTGPVSVRDLWPNADWLEREVWDMFGVAPADRLDIKRILLFEEFVGHPLRKDYPINKRQPLIGPKDEKPRERMTEADLRPKLVP